MNKLCLLSGMMAFAVASINASEVRKPGNIKEEQRRNIERIQWDKIDRQRELARPAVYKMIDAAIKETTISYDINGNLKEDPIIVNWPVLFNILDSMRGVIDVNEYRTYNRMRPLLYVAVKEGNALAAKTLLEKYNANPNFIEMEDPSTYTGEFQEMTPLMLARKQKDNAMVNLLIKYGAQ